MVVGSDNCSVEGRGEHENPGIVVTATEGEGEVGESPAFMFLPFPSFCVLHLVLFLSSFFHPLPW